MPSMIINGKKVKFKLEAFGEGLTLRAKKVDGEEIGAGYLLRINTDGTFTKETSVSTEIGLELTADKRKITVN